MYLNGRLPEEEDGRQSHIWVFVENVGLGMVLEMAEVPPVGGEALCGRRGLSGVGPGCAHLSVLQTQHASPWLPTAHPTLTFSCPITNCWAMWFHQDFLKTEVWPRSCCRYQL